MDDDRLPPQANGRLAAHAGAPFLDVGRFEPGLKLRRVEPIERGDPVQIALQIGIGRLIDIDRRCGILGDARQKFTQARIRQRVRQRIGFGLQAEKQNGDLG
jgi:hypothetical protein